ncbi:exopolysaccharide biosynthesis protein [Ideonella sp. 4Y11]|uniref:Exopolysaccharide biosynthesis protein n=1 Tax=Ideonella aquatica TaxID=2824119 RepID=A0A941BM14_9BURK|nr:exopolysaccharide biosynthesis protein [Ideonella aquatica]MBQ0960329.1 exopolysaccharide biosynthesis protein [Ideonella aquatica]
MTPPIAQRLRDAAESLGRERVTMQTLAQAHGPEAQGALLMLLAMPCLLPVPGVGTVLSLGMAALSLAMWRGQGEGLPPRVAALELPGPWARRVLHGLATAYALAGRHARQRLDTLTAARWHPALAAVVGLMALIVLLPIPFGNLLPSLALVLIGLGLVFRDGLAVALGLAGAALAVLVTAGLVAWAWTWGGDWAARWLS